MSRELPHMWSYWRDKRGSHAEALESDYPELLGMSEELRLCVAQIRMGEARIDQIMRKLEDSGEGLT